VHYSSQACAGYCFQPSKVLAKKKTATFTAALVFMHFLYVAQPTLQIAGGEGQIEMLLRKREAG
jgi:hypothetical protein